jgi:hypothetical protein
MEEPNVMTVSENGQGVTMFQAPDNRHVAGQLWVFLVENLRPGLNVDLSVPGLGSLKSETAVKLSAEQCADIMDGRAFSDD